MAIAPAASGVDALTASVAALAAVTVGAISVAVDGRLVAVGRVVWRQRAAHAGLVSARLKMRVSVPFDTIRSKRVFRNC